MLFYTTKDGRKWMKCHPGEWDRTPNHRREIIHLPGVGIKFVRLATDADEVDALIASLTEV